MSLLFILFVQLVTLARLARPGGIRAVAAESLAVKHHNQREIHLRRSTGQLWATFLY